MIFLFLRSPFNLLLYERIIFNINIYLNSLYLRAHDNTAPSRSSRVSMTSRPPKITTTEQPPIVSVYNFSSFLSSYYIIDSIQVTCNRSLLLFPASFAFRSFLRILLLDIVLTCRHRLIWILSVNSNTGCSSRHFLIFLSFFVDYCFVYYSSQEFHFRCCDSTFYLFSNHGSTFCIVCENRYINYFVYHYLGF